MFCCRDAPVKQRDPEMQQPAKKCEWTCIANSWCKLRKGNVGTELCFLCPPSYVIYFFQLSFCLFVSVFAIFVLKQFLELLLSTSHRSLNTRTFHIPNLFVKLKCLLGRRIKEKTQWQGCMVELVPNNDVLKREKKSQLQLSGQKNTWLYVVATTMKKL